MPARIRVFVSSTMEDLGNEREAVIEAIASLNLEPVNAEGVLPTGGTSWEVLEDEIRSSHICIFIQGDRYGWIPKEGYGAGQDKSVSHLEFDFARSCGIPVLPFFKQLKYASVATTEDAKRRDNFRNELGDWAKGHFRSEFRLAKDLKIKAREALLSLFTASYLKSEVQARELANPGPTTQHYVTSPHPHRASDEVLFAGAGLSLSAGYPSASALAGALAQALGLSPEQEGRHSLSQLFDFAELTKGRELGVNIVRELLEPPLPVEPTSAHIAAVRRFPVILTTNYDLLFERACQMLGIAYDLRTPGVAWENRQDAAVKIFKIDGSIDRPESLVLSLSDAARASEDGAFWSSIEEVLKTARPVVIGHSMRDSTSLRLMSRRNLTIEGIYVAPVIDPVDGQILLKKLNLKGFEKTASAYLWGEV